MHASHCLLTRSQALCDSRAVPGLIAFAGAYHMPDSGQIAIILEYMDGGSLQVCVRGMMREL